MGDLSRVHAMDTGEKVGIPHQRMGRAMIRMAIRRHRGQQQSRLQFTQYAYQYEPLIRRILDAAVWQARIAPPQNTQQSHGLRGLDFSLGHRAPGAEFTFGQIENHRRLSSPAQLAQQAANAQIGVVRVSAYGQHVNTHSSTSCREKSSWSIAAANLGTSSQPY